MPQDDPFGYSPSIEELERTRSYVDDLPQNVSSIESLVRSLEEYDFEKRENLERVAELVEKQNKLLEDQFYFTNTQNYQFLSMIARLVLLQSGSFIALVLLLSLSFFS